MNKLWIFGDSMSSDYGTHLLFPEVGDSWDRLLAKDLKLELKNKSRAGSGNDLIIRSLINNMHLMKEGDLVITGLTNPTRYYYKFKNETNIWHKQIFIGDWFLWTQKKGLINTLETNENNHPRLNIITDYYKNIHIHASKRLGGRDTRRAIGLQKALTQKSIRSLVWKWQSKDYPNDIKKPIETVGDKIGKAEAHFSFDGHKDFYERLKIKLDKGITYWDNIYE